MPYNPAPMTPERLAEISANMDLPEQQNPYIGSYDAAFDAAADLLAEVERLKAENTRLQRLADMAEDGCAECLERLKAAEATGAGWIDVRQRLPEPGQRVLCFTPIGPINHFVGRHLLPNKEYPAAHWQGSARHKYDQITHWQPLPPAP